MAEARIGDEVAGPRLPAHETVAAVVRRGRAQPNQVELGWVIVGRLDAPDRAATRDARRRLLALMRDQFPEFTWRMPLVERTDLPVPLREEPVELLYLGLEERDARHWDYVLVVTGSDLIGHAKPFTLAAPSRALGVGVLSTARIDPQAQGAELTSDARTEALAQRATTLALHLLAHLAGCEDVGASVHILESVSDLDRQLDLGPDARAAMREELRAVADLRVEEARPPAAKLPFYARSMWVNRGAIAGAIGRARPWLFPLRLTKLTTAAMSTLLILINTAEVWEVAMSLSPAAVLVLSVLTLAATSSYVVGRQRLLRRRHRRLTEQAVTTNVSLSVIVTLGMLTTYVLIFVLASAVSTLLYPDRVIASWSGLVATSVTGWHHVALSGFVASLGIVIGALGASFEQQHYFQHMVYVDEEV